MDLNEARQILSNNGFITERASDMGGWRQWFDEYEESHPDCKFFDIQDMIKELADEFDEDWRRHYSEPEYAIDISYEELCDKWGKPEEN